MDVSCFLEMIDRLVALEGPLSCTRIARKEGSKWFIR